MKNKKALLIASAAVLAGGIATAGVASFAWYSATNSAALSSTSNASVATSQQTLPGVNLVVSFTMTAENDVELTNGSGETWYYSNGVPVQKTTGLKQVGVYNVSNPQWVGASADVLSTLEAKDYTVTLESTDNVHLQDGTSWTSTDAVPTFTLHVADGGALSITAAGTATTLAGGVISGHFNVRAVDTSITGTGHTDATEIAGHTADAISIESIE